MVQDISPTQAWDMLRADPETQLIDVRTQGEWQDVGVPELSEAGKHVRLVCWQYASGEVNAGFVDQLSAEGVQPGQRLLFLCRSGVRSLAAAEAAQHAGFSASFNVAGGFEGPPDARGRRGAVAGWQAERLPWRR